MKKMPCLYVRIFDGPRKATITDEVTPGCQWVFGPDVRAYTKRDGTACAVIGGELYKRYDAKRGKLPPPDAIPCDDPDPITGHHPHWVKVDRNNPSDKWHIAALDWATGDGNSLSDGTYELCGPHFQNNPEGFKRDIFIPHMDEVHHTAPDFHFHTLREFMSTFNQEGLVIKHSDGLRMCKIRRADFGFNWPVKS